MTTKGLLAAALALSLFALAGCERMTIAEVTGDPGRFRNKDINIAGKVTHLSVGALGVGFYQIDDGTGKLYVFSEKNGAPREGAYVGVRGRLEQTFTFMGKDYATVLRETDRRSARPSE